MRRIHLRKAYGETRLKTRNATPLPPSPAAAGLRRDRLSQTRFLGSVVSLELAIVKKQRARLIELRDKGEITEDTLRRFQSILDLKESQLDQTRSSWEV